MFISTIKINLEVAEKQQTVPNLCNNVHCITALLLSHRRRQFVGATAEFWWSAISTANNLWYHFGTCLVIQTVIYKIICDSLLNVTFVDLVVHTNVSRYVLQWNWLKTKLLRSFWLQHGHMILPTTNLQPDIEKLSFNIQPHKSHYIYWIYDK